MKRSYSSLESIPEAGATSSTAGAKGAAPGPTPKLKRAQTDAGIGNHRISEVVSAKDGMLKVQNRALNMELSKRKRDLLYLQEELNDAVSKERIKEAEFVGANVILSELDTCVRAILGATDGGIDVVGAVSITPAAGKDQFLALGNHPLMNRANLSALTFDVDEWCPAEAYEQAAITHSVAEMSAEIRQLLSDRAAFLTGALEQLTKARAIPASAFESSCAKMLASTEAEKLLLQTELARVKSAVNDMGKRLFISEKRRRQAEKELDANQHSGLAEEKNGECSDAKLQQTGVSATVAACAPAHIQRQNAAAMNVPHDAAVVSNVVANGHAGGETFLATRDCPAVVSGAMASAQDQAATAEKVAAEISAMASDIEVLKRDAELLTKQLTETESRRSAAERSLNDHLAAAPVGVGAKDSEESEIFAVIKNKFMEHISFLQLEISALRSRMEASQTALSTVEESSTTQIDVLATATKEEVVKLTWACAENEKRVAVLEAENKGLRSLKLQASELSLTVDSLRAECTTLRDQKKKLVSAIERLEINLSQSRAREAALCGSNNINSDSSTAHFATLSTREEDLATELEDAKAQMSDLFLEIETVVNSEEKSREQSARLLQQMADSQQTQQSVHEENSLLQHEVKSLRNKLKEADNRFVYLQGYNAQQDILLGQLKTNEKKLSAENSKASDSVTDAQAKISLLQTTLLEAEHKASSETIRCDALKKKWMLLSERVNNLTNELDTERKKRIKFESTARKYEGGDKKRVERTSSSSSNMSDEGGGGGHNQEMLDLTLDMLRCSVCRDRFKAVAITRCFHLFCKECIDENLRNRQRKCPACGEKFGQDDVRPVFFTH